MRSRRREAELGAVAPLPVLWLASGRGAAVWGGRRGARPPWLLAEAKAGGRAKGEGLKDGAACWAGVLGQLSPLSL